MNLKVLIAGAGIGGLTAAIALARHQCDVTLLEQAAQLGEVGAGLQLSPNAMQVLDHLGLGPALSDASYEPHHAVFRHFKTGKTELAMPLRSHCQARYGQKYLHIHRADLHRALVKAATHSGVRLLTGQPITTYTEEPHSVTVSVSDGTRHKGDVLIGADGIKSIIRKVMLGEEKRRFTGQVAWRGLIEAKRLAPDTIPEDATIWPGSGKHFVTYYIKGGALINFVAVEERDAWTEENWSLPGKIDQLRAAFAGWDPRITALLDQCSECFEWGLFDHPPLPRWTSKRVALLGDACHPMLPFMAQGAAMAIEDAHVLAEILGKQPPDMTAALARYEALRKPRTSMVQKISADNAKLFHLSSPLTRFGRNLTFKLGQKFPIALQSRLDKVYGVNVTGEMR